MATSTAAATSHKPFRVIAAASIGNALEWYDIAVYAIFATVLSKVFFPAQDETVSLLLTLGTFGVSFLIRPIGAVVLGAYADRAGRKASLTLSIRLMVLGTAIICLMPSYETVGLVAPIGILLARLIQGFSAGGEFGSATAFMVEHMPGRRGFVASWQFASQGLSTLVSAGMGVLLTTTLSPEQLESWGWRIPFAVGLLVGPVGYYIRRFVDEAPEFTATQTAEPHSPVRTVLRTQKARILLVVGALLVSTVLNYTITYMPTYAIKQLGLPASTSFAATLATGIVLTVVTPLAGHLSDKIGRVKLMGVFAALILLLIYPIFATLVAFPGFGVMVGMMLLIGLLKACYFGALPALMSELFPTETRATGMSIGYNIGVSVFGGFTPFISTWLIGLTGTSLAPSFYLMFAAAASLLSLLVIRRRLGLR
ncbi:MFS transporter [Saccharopolyspora shandongensis]|uniref:Putative proline/betaine transporter n=1 Tax=Saccharopolyspora shandongensis TaxID=418495 RepID=A0A1H3SBC9_9PSEU|nr:MFS transporter [Saccharopolyspora shandongensis]SDZ35234.1 MFS transporter, MHS family, proline/betaine transporter [Saccharopolyspora shandongensis]